MLHFYTLINHTDCVISLVTNHFGIPTIFVINVEQVSQLRNLVLSIQDQMQQHLTNHGIAWYPFKTLLSSRYSLKQIADYHHNRHDSCLSVARMPMLPNEEPSHWANKALSHLQAKVECDQFTSQAQISLDYLKHLGVGQVWHQIAYFYLGMGMALMKETL